MKKHLLLTLLCGAFVLVGCTGTNEEGGGGGDVSGKMKWVTDPQMTYEVITASNYAVYVKGTAQNISGKKLSYVQCSFSLYDSSGANIGSAWDNVSNLAVDDKWQVSAVAWTEFAPTKFVFSGFSQF